MKGRTCRAASADVAEGRNSGVRDELGSSPAVNPFPPPKTLSLSKGSTRPNTPTFKNAQQSKNVQNIAETPRPKPAELLLFHRLASSPDRVTAVTQFRPSTHNSPKRFPKAQFGSTPTE